MDCCFNTAWVRDGSHLRGLPTEVLQDHLFVEKGKFLKPMDLYCIGGVLWCALYIVREQMEFPRGTVNVLGENATPSEEVLRGHALWLSPNYVQSPLFPCWFLRGVQNPVHEAEIPQRSQATSSSGDSQARTGAGSLGVAGGGLLRGIQELDPDTCGHPAFWVWTGSAGS